MTRRRRISGTEPDGSTNQEPSWDYDNRLIHVSDNTAGGTVTNDVSFTYDVLNRRIVGDARLVLRQFNELG